MLQALPSDIHVPAADTACAENIHDAGDPGCAKAQGRKRDLFQQIQCSRKASEALVPPVQTPHEVGHGFPGSGGITGERKPSDNGISGEPDLDKGMCRCRRLVQGPDCVPPPIGFLHAAVGFLVCQHRRKHDDRQEKRRNRSV